jgi:hypothetical protein
VEVQDLTASGPISVSTNTLSSPLSVDIPADAVSINFVGQAVSDPTARLVVYRLEQTVGTTTTRLYDYASTANQMKVLPPTGPGAFSVLYPNSPNVPFVTSNASTTSKVTIKLLASKPTTASVKALIKHGPNTLTTGSVNLNFFFVGLSNLNASTAPSDSNFQQIVSTVKQIWGNAGVNVDSANIKYIDITGSDATTYRDLQEPDLGKLMMLSNNTAAQTNALNVFFVHTITGGSLDGYIILGESAGIPGVPLLGTSGSGMAVTTSDFPSGLFDIADTIAHEGGHWLGLFHTTESAGTSFDPLPDTGECPQSQFDSNGDKIMQPGECINGHGAENEMFWTSVNSITHTGMTPNQSFVLLRNPAVK